jgi:hypothetical protein
MYEPTWVSPGKHASAWAEGAAHILTVAGLLVATRARRHRQSPHRSRRSLPASHACGDGASAAGSLEPNRIFDPARSTHWLAHTASAEIRKDNHHDQHETQGE